MQNALVFADYNGDGLQGPGEPGGVTDATGAATFYVDPNSVYNIVVKTSDNTVDTANGEKISNITLTAPLGSAVVTPTTTVLVEVQKQDPSVTEEAVAKALGLEGVDLTQFNPFNKDADPATATAVEKISVAVFNTAETMKATGDIAGVKPTIAGNNAYRAIAEMAILAVEEKKEDQQNDEEPTEEPREDEGAEDDATEDKKDE